MPGYKDPEVYKAMAKLAGLNPSDVKYQRPDSPGGYHSNKHGGPVSVGQISASPKHLRIHDAKSYAAKSS